MMAGATNEKPRDDVAIISAGVAITGEVSSTIDLQIDGRVLGDVRCTTLFLGETGVLEGNVQADRIRVSGAIDGNVVAGDVAVEATGRINGDVSYNRLKVTAGAVIEGMIRHQDTGTTARAATPAETAASLKLVDGGDAAAQRRVFGD